MVTSILTSITKPNPELNTNACPNVEIAGLRLDLKGYFVRLINIESAFAVLVISENCSAINCVYP